MGFFSTIFNWLNSRGSNSESTQESPAERPSDGGDIGEGPAGPSNDDPIGNIFGGTDPGDREEQVEQDLKEFDPKDDAGGLFYLGWLDPNVSPDVRDRAREQFEQKYGVWDPRKGRKSTGSDDWAKWRKYMGYAA